MMNIFCLYKDYVFLSKCLCFLDDTEIGDFDSSDKVKYGIYGSSKGYRMIDGYLLDNFTALCGFGRSKSFLNLHNYSDLMFCYVSLSVCLSVCLSLNHNGWL